MKVQQPRRNNFAQFAQQLEDKTSRSQETVERQNQNNIRGRTATYRDETYTQAQAQAALADSGQHNKRRQMKSVSERDQKLLANTGGAES